MKVESVVETDEVIDFLAEHFPSNETVLSALRIKASPELRRLLRDTVTDCSGKGCVSRVMKDGQGRTVGVILATAEVFLDKHLDRLYSYSFKEEPLRILNSFAQTVFNRLDIAYHLEQAAIRHPVFIALICVRRDLWGKGIGRSLLKNVLSAGKELGCDGGFALASSERTDAILGQFLENAPQCVTYDSWKGEYKCPPIVPIDRLETKMVLRVGRI